MAPTTPQAPSTDLTNFSIALIDDDGDFRRLLGIRFKAIFDPIVLFEFDGITKAREFFGKRNHPEMDLVVLDQHMPDGKGLDLLSEGIFEGTTVLSVSSDNSPEMPGALITAGAAYFLKKSDISQPLFEPLVRGIVDRNRIQRELDSVRVNHQVVELVRAHIGTLQHEINNPLGAVLGAAYLLRNEESASPEQREAARLVETSGKRIKHVLDEICSALQSNMQLKRVVKGDQNVFEIPGDKPWGEQ